MARPDVVKRFLKFSPVLLALAVVILAPSLALAQDGYISLRGTSQVLRFDPGNPTVVSNTIALAGVPAGVAVSPDGNTVYVIVGANSVYRIVGNVLDSTPITTGLQGVPEQIAVSPDGTKLFITNAANNTRLWFIDLANGNAQTQTFFTAGQAAWGVDAVTTAAGDRVYVSLGGAGLVRVFDAVSNAAVASITVGTTPQGVAASPLGDRVYVANFNSDTVSVIDTATNSVIDTISVGDGPQELTVSADGTRVYVSLKNAGDVAVVDTTTGTLVDTVDVGVGGDSLHGISFSADGAFVVVVHFGTHKISVIDPDGDPLVVGDDNTFVTTGPISSTQPRYVAFQPLAPATPDTAPEFVLPLCDATIAATLGVELTVPVSVVDDNGVVVTLVESPPNSGALDAPFPVSLSTSVNGTFRWTPTASDNAGDYDLIFTADDQVNAPVSCTVTISVPAPPIDNPPTLDSDVCGETLTPALGDTVSFTVDAADDNSVTLSVVGLPDGASMTPGLPASGSEVSSEFSWTPTGDDAGTYEVTFVADDGVNPAVECTVTIVVPEPAGGDETEFIGFRLGLAKMDTHGHHATSFWFNGNFAVDLQEGDGIDPSEEVVVLGIEGTEFTIPAGEFDDFFRGRLFRFRGVVNGAKLLVHITQLTRKIYNINVTGWDATIPNPKNPLELCVRIGDDFGCDSKRGQIH